MKKICCQLALGLGLSIIINSGTQVFAQSADINIKVTPPPPSSLPQDKDSCPETEEQLASQSIRLYYLRSATTIKGILDKIAEANPCIKGAVIEAQGDSEIILHGNRKQRDELQRTIAILDLPRESVNMDMWGIRISSDNPEQLARAMREVNQEIDKTQRLLQYTYKRLEDFARDIRIERGFKSLFEDTLGYRTALDNNKPSLSMVDILLRTNVAEKPIENYNSAAGKLCKLFFAEENEKYHPYVTYLQRGDRPDEATSNPKPQKLPFGNYFRVGLHQDQLNPDYKLTPDCYLNIKSDREENSSELSEKEREEQKKPKKPKKHEVRRENLRVRGAILDFALHYSYLENKPEDFDPRSLQQSAENLNAVLNPVVDAVNRDVKELFIEPTLAEIQRIVSEYDDVEYAEVGKTTVAGLNGIESTVESNSVSAFDETPPLRLDELLADADISAEDLLPEAATNAIPAASVAKLVAAFGKDRSLWRELTSGVTLNITPSVLRNSTSAELEVSLTTGSGEGGTKEEGVRPLSRISQNHVKTSVYVDTLDIFALSTFNNQTTIDGGRTYIPIVGTVWEGVFSGIPVFGDLFSWQNEPKNVQHQSIVLTNSFIVPTAMGLAPLYSQEVNGEFDFSSQCVRVENYIENYKSKIDPKQSSEEQSYFFSQLNLPEDNGTHPICEEKISNND